MTLLELIDPPKVHKELQSTTSNRSLHFNSVSNESSDPMSEETERSGYELKERLAILVLQESATMLHSMHQGGYVHGDIKGENIMISGGGVDICNGIDFQGGVYTVPGLRGACRGSNDAQHDGGNIGKVSSYRISLIDLGHAVEKGKTSCGTYEVGGSEDGVGGVGGVGVLHKWSRTR